MKDKRKSRVLGDVTDRERNIDKPKEKLKPLPERLQIPKKDAGSVDRVKAFERLKQLERERFREEDEDEADEDAFADDGIIVRGYGEESRTSDLRTASSAGWTTTTKVDELHQFVHVERPLETPVEEQPSRPRIVTPDGDISRDGMFYGSSSNSDAKLLSKDSQISTNNLPRCGNDSSLSLFKQGLKVSIGKHNCTQFPTPILTATIRQNGSTLPVIHTWTFK